MAHARNEVHPGGSGMAQRRRWRAPEAPFQTKREPQGPRAPSRARISKEAGVGRIATVWVNRRWLAPLPLLAVLALAAFPLGGLSARTPPPSGPARRTGPTARGPAPRPPTL